MALPGWLQVETTTCGMRSLSQCFLKTTGTQEHLPLLTELQVPFLHVPDPSASHWGYLAHSGVSMSITWQDLYKILQRLSTEKATPPLQHMAQLYRLVDSCCTQTPAAVPAVTAAFQAQRLIYVPDGNGVWMTSQDAVWSGNRHMLPHLTFIRRHYKVSVSFPPLLAGSLQACSW